MSGVMQLHSGASNNTDLKIDHNKSKKQAAKNITLAIVVNSWRQKREEVKSLRESLALRTSSEKQLRRQVASLRTLLGAEGGASNPADDMANIKRFKDLEGSLDEKKALESEKSALQRTASLAEQRASGLQELWRSCKADLVAARLNAAQAHAALSTERAKARLGKEQNVELLDKVSEQDKSIEKLKNNLHEAREEITSLKAVLQSKEENISSMESEIRKLKKYINQQDIELKAKDNELHSEMLKTEELDDQINKLKNQLIAFQDKLNKWPFYLTPGWPLHYRSIFPGNVTSWWSNISTNIYQRFLRVSFVFANR